MAIDTSGTFWKGTCFADLVEYIQAYTADGYVAQRVLQCRCQCGGTVFKLTGDQDEGCAARTCTSCHTSAYICDSDEIWDDASPTVCTCPCGGSTYEVGVGFSLRPDGEVRWITIGERCVTCGTLGSFVDWKIDYSPTSHLFKQA